MNDSPVDETLTTSRTALLRIYGRVQGVGFRMNAQEEAQKLGLSGWVRNRADETVEAKVIGANDDVGQFIQWCQTGPPMASVTRVDVTELSPEPIGEHFEIRATE